jgi:hypothetical protein
MEFDMSDYRNEFRSAQSEYYWTLPRVFVGMLSTVALLAVIGFGLNYVGYANFVFFAPRMEAVRRQTVVESRAYSEGQLRETYRLKLQYVQAQTADERDTIKAFLQHEVQSFDRTRLPADLQVFLNQIGA